MHKEIFRFWIFRFLSLRAKFTIAKARYNSTSHLKSANTRIISRINVHLEHIVECFSFFFAKFYVEEKMRFFVEESEFASGENDDGALILLMYSPPLCFVFSPSEDHCARKDVNASLRREIKTHLSFIISRSQIRSVFGNEGF